MATALNGHSFPKWPQLSNNHIQRLFTYGRKIAQQFYYSTIVIKPLDFNFLCVYHQFVQFIHQPNYVLFKNRNLIWCKVFICFNLTLFPKLKPNDQFLCEMSTSYFESEFYILFFVTEYKINFKFKVVCHRVI